MFASEKDIECIFKILKIKSVIYRVDSLEEKEFEQT